MKAAVAAAPSTGVVVVVVAGTAVDGTDSGVLVHAVTTETTRRVAVASRNLCIGPFARYQTIGENHRDIANRHIVAIQLLDSVVQHHVAKWTSNCHFVGTGGQSF
jgi:hypothetical protein